ncbi:hypothetical protein OAX78_02430 [Planctomycetota bacterium]|nr:hypothetical protein [Planctomycetota bacterium]
MTDDFPKPKPKRRFMTIRDLQGKVTARHKVLASSGPTEDAVTLIQDEYGSDDGSSLAFVKFLRGEPLEEGGPSVPGKNAIERRHIVGNETTGEMTHVETEPGSIPPKPIR